MVRYGYQHETNLAGEEILSRNITDLAFHDCRRQGLKYSALIHVLSGKTVTNVQHPRLTPLQYRKIRVLLLAAIAFNKIEPNLARNLLDPNDRRGRLYLDRLAAARTMAEVALAIADLEGFHAATAAAYASPVPNPYAEYQ